MTNISKLIHVCWFGSKPFPEAYQKNLARWELLTAETDWRVLLWTDESEDFHLLRYMMQVHGAVPVQVANTMRLALLYMYGGVYVDADIIPLRLPVFEPDNVLTLFRETNGEKQSLTNSVIASPPHNRELLFMFWWTMKKMQFPPPTRKAHLKAGAGMFEYFPQDWFCSVARRGVNHWSPVSWEQARALNIAHKYTYEDWLSLAETFLPNQEVYGVHTYDSTWVYELNERILEGKNDGSDKSQG